MKKIKKVSLLLIILFGQLCSCNTNQKKDNKIKNLIILIGDGMGLMHLASYALYNNKSLPFKDFNFINSNTLSYGTEGDYIQYITDSAAGGTALSTGQVTLNSYVGKSKEGEDLTTILDIAKSINKSTGIVTNDNVYGATIADFSAHTKVRTNREEIFNTQIDSGVDVIIGAKATEYADKKDKIIEKGYSYHEEGDEIDYKNTNKLFYQSSPVEASGKQTLLDTTKIALNVLNKNKDGFALMVEQSYTDSYSEKNDFINTIKAVNSFMEVTEYLLKTYSQEDTLFIITADHETGGLYVQNGKGLPNEINVDGRTLSYVFNTTYHSAFPVGLFINRDYDFTSLNYYHSPRVIKNAEVFNIMNDFLKM